MTSLTFLRMRRCGTAADALPRRHEIFPNMGAHHADIRVHRDKYSYHNDIISVRNLDLQKRVPLRHR
ncbi:hypothetical protein LGM75_26450 [Burkholderia multivorans]|uniref:hypothetical protein n=1 Tax=Burkholderia multivorans TaxID=87883 RepID=UPI00143EBF69|nr:hypothetical protein [Burkholderia multivorans]MBU9468866.1 hypothetical protein [Burkholderia multivorans]MCA8129899.1 hypothetical protein [Burkholderia multivorans]QIX14113.1 hypothetical protein FOB32_00390 [Burkholderia multivorans]